MLTWEKFKRNKMIKSKPKTIATWLFYLEENSYQFQFLPEICWVHTIVSVYTHDSKLCPLLWALVFQLSLKTHLAAGPALASFGCSVYVSRTRVSANNHRRYLFEKFCQVASQKSNISKILLLTFCLSRDSWSFIHLHYLVINCFLSCLANPQNNRAVSADIAE